MGQKNCKGGSGIENYIVLKTSYYGRWVVSAIICRCRKKERTD